MRSRGTGTIRRRPDGRYEGRLFLGLDPQTQQPRRHSVYGDTHTECSRRLEEACEQFALTGQVADPRLTLGGYLQSWQADHVARRLRPQSAESYASTIRIYILPTLGHVKLGALTVRAVQGWVNRLQDGGTSSRMIGLARAVLRSALSEARRLGLVAHNVASGVRVPTYTRRRVKALTPEQARAILEASAIEPHLEALIWLTLARGLRRSEALGLYWSDVNLAASTVHITKQLAWDRGRKIWTRQPLKSERSERILILPDKLVVILRRQQRRIALWRKAARTTWAKPAHPWVFPSRVGTAIEPRNLHRGWIRIRAGAGLPTMRFHDLRHGSATLSLLLNTPMKVISEQLGHSGIQITADTYGHVLPALEVESAAKLGALLPDPTIDPTSTQGKATHSDTRRRK